VARIASISIDLDSLSHYCRIHALPEDALGPGGDTAVYRLAIDRFVELCQETGVRGTLFAVGQDLQPGQAALAKAARSGFEIGNHTYWHDYALAQKSPAAISADILRGGDAIEAAVGKRPRGFRAPGYTFNAAMYRALEQQGYRYGSSVFPAAPYYLAKAGVLAYRRITGTHSAAILDRREVLGAPRLPYLPDPAHPYRRGLGRVPELPITVEPVSRLPFYGTAVVALPPAAVRALYLSVARLPFLNLELHGVDLMDASDGAGDELSRRQRDLQIPAARKRERLKSMLHRIAQDYDVKTLAEASQRLP
jgi:peptidoglycan/xylan/chitin deacetylase (PgdA/CDA1 family)